MNIQIKIKKNVRSLLNVSQEMRILILSLERKIKDRSIKENNEIKILFLSIENSHATMIR
jgi:hypothetical protein